MPQINSKIAVLLAVYNGEKWLSEQLSSIINQNDVDITIYISIDPSTDASESLCNAYASQYDSIKLLSVSEKFGGAAKNFFRLIRDVDYSNYDYLAFADQDDIWFQSKLINAVRALTKTDNDGYSSNITAFWSTGKKKLIKKSQPQRKWDYLFEAAGPGCTYVMTTKLALDIKKTIVANWSDANKLGLHDWFCYAYARANGYKWYIDHATTMLYRQHENNQVGVNSGIKALVYRLRVITSGWGIKQSILIAKMVGKVDDPFVKKWAQSNRFGFLKLALCANECRRKVSERILFFISCLLMAVVVKSHSDDEYSI